MRDDSDVTDDIDAVGTPDSDAEPDHDTTNGRWLEQTVSDTLEDWGYGTDCNVRIFGLDPDVIARNSTRGEPKEFPVVERNNW